MGGFVNCSNHPSGGWLKAQKDAAEKYGTITDIPFPAVRCNLCLLYTSEKAVCLKL